MDLPLLVSQRSLGRLRDQLTAAAGQLGRVAAEVDGVALQVGWRGNAQRAFAAVAASTGRHCLELSARLLIDAARVERLEAELAAELAVLRRLEHEVLGALHRLAARAVDDTTGEARSLYDRVRQRLPGSGSPRWRDLASTLVGGELE